MSDLLILTTLDVEGRRNNREHHAIAELGRRFGEVWVVYRRRGRPGNALRDTLLPSLRRRNEGRVHYLAVSPGLNPPEGAVREHLGEEAGAARLADVGAIGKDLATVLALAVVASRVPRGAACQAFGPWAAAAARILRAAGRIPAYAYVDRDFEPGFVSSTLRRRWAAAMERAGLRHADLRLSIGGRLRALREAEAGAPVHLSPTGVEAARFPPKPRDLPRVDLIFSGRIAPWSGLEEAIEALALLLPGHPEARLRAFGPVTSGYRAVLETQAVAAGVAGRFELAGEVDQNRLRAAMDEAAIGLAVFRPVPLRVYAAPLKLFEYMANGLPLIALEDSETGDLAAAAGAGELARAEPAAIAAAVERLVADPARYRAMSRAGIAAARAHDWSRIMAREHALMSAVPAAGLAPA